MSENIKHKKLRVVPIIKPVYVKFRRFPDENLNNSQSTVPAL